MILTLGDGQVDTCVHISGLPPPPRARACPRLLRVGRTVHTVVVRGVHSSGSSASAFWWRAGLASVASGCYVAPAIAVHALHGLPA